MKKRTYSKLLLGLTMVILLSSTCLGSGSTGYQNEPTEENSYCGLAPFNAKTDRFLDDPIPSWNIEYIGSCPTALHAIRVIPQGDYAYIIDTLYPEPTSNLTIVSIADPLHPEMISTFGGFYLVFDLYVQGNYAYISDFYATPGYPSRVYQIDVSNPENPMTTAFIGAQGNARALFAQGNYVYSAEFGGGVSSYLLGTPGLTFKSQCYTTSNANEIFVQGNYAYIADSGMSGGNDALTIVDISNPNALQMVGSCKVGSNEYHTPVSVYVQDTTAYLADINGISIIDVSNPAHPTRIITIEDFERYNYVEVHDQFMYCIVDFGIVVYNISNPLDPLFIGHYDLADVSALAVYGSYVYAASWDGGLQILQFTEPESGWPNTPLTPTGPANGLRNIPYEFTSNATDPEGDQVLYQWFWDDGTLSEWEGPYDSGTTVVVDHIWSVPGSFGVRMRAKDVFEHIGDWSQPHEITIVNSAPEPPTTPEGPAEGDIVVNHVFSTSSTDPEGDQIRYGWDWNGDYTIDEWTGLNASGTMVTASHLWEKPGTYTIQVIANDSYGSLSAWSEPFMITIHGPELKISTVTTGVLKMRVIAYVTNTGDRDAVDVTWTIMFGGGLIIVPKDDSSTGVIDRLAPGDAVTVKTSSFGLGRSEITTIAQIANVPPVRKTISVFLLGPFVLIR